MENFSNVLNYFEVFANSTIKNRTQIFPKIDENHYNELKDIHTVLANDNKH